MQSRYGAEVVIFAILTRVVNFVRPFGGFWKLFPAEEALAVARMIVARAAEEPDAGTSARVNEIQFSSSRQNTLFMILHVLRPRDPHSLNC